MRQPPPKKWEFTTPDLDESVRLAAKLGVTPLVGQLLINRNIKDVENAKAYLTPKYDKLHDPSELEDMSKVVDRIQRAKKYGETICVYGDFDADGTTATALLLDTFDKIGIHADYFIPNRFTDGYGLSIKTVKKIYETGAKLIITVDCGITSISEVKLANDIGMDVIITDHHQPTPDGTPPAHAVIAPKMSESNYPYKDLAGVGLAFKLAQGICNTSDIQNSESYLKSLLDLVVLGTVVDLVPLTGENRALSRLGLNELNTNNRNGNIYKRNRIGIHELCRVAGYESRKLVGQSLSFALGPRINAAGRMDTAEKVVQLLTTTKKEVAEKIASELDNRNRERQKLEASIRQEAVEMIKVKIDSETKGIVVASENWPKKAQGVVGIVASRLVEMYHRPVFVIVINGDEATGSGRCIEGMNLADSLNSCKELLIKFGGHAAAAGLTLKSKNIEKFEEHFNSYTSKKLSDEYLQPKLKLDFETNLSVLTLETLDELDKFEPFGRENDPPRFGTYRLKISGSPTLLGKEKKHLSMFLSDGVTQHKSIAWQAGEELIHFKGPNRTVDIAYTPEINEWQGNKSIQLMLRNWHPPQSVEREGKHAIYPPSDVDSAAKVVDGRDQNKRDYLFTLLDKNESCIIYVQNSEMIDLLFTRLLPEKTDRIARYDDSLESQKVDLLTKLDSGELQAIVSSDTIHIPEKLNLVKHFVFCHLTSNADEFFKRCKPAIKSNEMSYLHLIYKESDVSLLNNWISQKYPEETILKQIYRDIRDIIHNSDISGIPEDEILNGTESKPDSIKTALNIFEELEFIQIIGELCDRRIILRASNQTMLTCSGTYLKGEWIKQTCQYFSEFQLQQDIKKIWERIKNECGISNTSDSDA